MRSTDPRDKIYALMPLTVESTAQVFTPNYDLPARDLFISVAEYMIRKDQNLNVLGLSRGMRNGLVPTWVPDWSSNDQAKPFRSTESPKPEKTSRSILPARKPNSMAISTDYKDYYTSVELYTTWSTRKQ